MKRYFVIPYLSILFGLVVYGGYEIYSGQWLAILLVAGLLPMLSFMMGIMIKQKGRTRERLYPELALAVVALIASLVLSQFAFAMILLVFGVAGILIYDFWYSNLGRENVESLQQGELCPEFSLYDLDGNELTSKSLTKSPAVWMFIRGNWCPLCVAQIKEMAEEYKQLKDLGAEVFVIASQPEEQTQALAKKFDVPFNFMVDKDSSAVKSLGIQHVGGVPAGMPGYGEDTVLPTIFITDSEGKIIYSDQTSNYRVRPEPADFIKVLQSQKA